ncbi:diguanylate cyclase [Maridesulfovibrio sp.]|uniref:GGDEF domain-containing response regulator n=1 Tax=Maridesulfovibrio sp. TaxID=2795000 RepID=UPI002A1874A4|nr:diguanylate cyclase [Maridesulfovibrio sp.]
MTIDDASRSERQKILVVDDSKQNLELLMDLFCKEYKIVAALNGERALKLARTTPHPDLILLDIVMPDMDGYEVCKRLKEDDSTKDIPVIFVTAVSEIMDETRGFEAGGVDYITKPFHPPMVKARVQMHLALKRKQKLLEEYAYLDALTEIPNRRHFDNVLRKECNRSLRSHQGLSLLIMDIDDFKGYNDGYGHAQGDEVLRRVAQTLSKALRRAGDFLARYGGEEFAAVLPYTDAKLAVETAEDLRREIESLGIMHKSGGGALTISLGVASVPPNKEIFPAELLEAADKALYKAKDGGRNRVESVTL